MKQSLTAIRVYDSTFGARDIQLLLSFATLLKPSAVGPPLSKAKYGMLSELAIVTTPVGSGDLGGRVRAMTTHKQNFRVRSHKVPNTL